MNTRHLIRAIREANPYAQAVDIARVLGLSRQRVHQILNDFKAHSRLPGEIWTPDYETEAAYARRVIRERGRIWEGCRPAFEAGDYQSENLARMLREGVIEPADDPDGGYVLPVMAREECEG